ncbi:MAG: hypothetical protein MI756_03835 [Chromatiales bacterium]|nr:hypothetical protein [Chromatiales bacterium]
MAGAGQDPVEVAEKTFAAATDGTDTLRYPVGNDALQILEARNQMDDVHSKSMIKQLFGL